MARRSWLVALVACAGCAQVLGLSDPVGAVGSDGGPGSGADGGSGSGSGSDGVACAPIPHFGAFTDYSAPGALDLAVGDVDGNGILDLVVAMGGAGVIVFPGTGGGHFGASFALPQSAPPASGVVLADVDQDGKLDVVTWGVSPQVVVYHQTDMFKFTPVTFMADAPVVAIVAADVNADGRPDLVVGSTSSISTWIASKTTPGAFTAGQLVVAPLPLPVGVVDVDGDGLLDIVVSNSSNLAIYYNAPANPGQFSGPVPVGGANTGGVFGHFALGEPPAGPLDLVIFDQNMKTGALYKQPTPRGLVLAAAATLFIDSFSVTGKPGIQAIDANGDGLDDVISLGEIAVQCPAGSGFYPPGSDTTPVSIGPTGPSNVQLLRDLDADGKPDLLVINDAAGGASFVQVALQTN